MDSAGKTLDTAFCAADYDVWPGRHSVKVSVGARCPPVIASWLWHARRPRGWIITAHNPGAALCSALYNRRGDTRLRGWVRRNGFSALATKARDPDGVWPDEPGVLVAGPSFGRVRLVAARLGQVAVVEVCRTAPARLRWMTGDLNAARCDPSRARGIAGRESPA